MPTTHALVGPKSVNGQTFQSSCDFDYIFSYILAALSEHLMQNNGFLKEQQTIKPQSK